MKFDLICLRRTAIICDKIEAFHAMRRHFPSLFQRSSQSIPFRRFSLRIHDQKIRWKSKAQTEINNCMDCARWILSRIFRRSQWRLWKLLNRTKLRRAKLSTFLVAHSVRCVHDVTFNVRCHCFTQLQMRSRRHRLLHDNWIFTIDSIVIGRANKKHSRNKLSIISPQIVASIWRRRLNQ